MEDCTEPHSRFLLGLGPWEANLATTLCHLHGDSVKAEVTLEIPFSLFYLVAVFLTWDLVTVFFLVFRDFEDCQGRQAGQ